MNNEAMLKAVIEAQVKGGYQNGWKVFLDSKFRLELDWVILEEDGEHASILEILLDPSGLRAAYGEKAVCESCLNRIAAQCHCGVDEGEGFPDVLEFYIVAARRILDAWLSKPEGDTDAALQTAFDLLPQA